MDNRTKLLKALPKVDECIGLLDNNPELIVPVKIMKSVVQSIIERERQKILREDQSCREISLDEWVSLFEEEISLKLTHNFRRVINGTGIVIHTNL